MSDAAPRLVAQAFVTPATVTLDQADLDREPRDLVGQLRVVVVDADDRTRESVAALLRICGRFRVVGSAGHLEDAIRLVEELHPDVVLMDPRLPDVAGGVTLIRAIHRVGAGARILAVGWSPELEHDTLRAGADGFVRKTFRPAELADALDRCMAPLADRVAATPIPQE